MHHRLAHGRELLRFFLNHDHVMVEDEFGQAIVCHRKDINSLFIPITIPDSQPIAHGLLQYTLARGGFTEQEFWDEIG